ncbi:protein dopey [Trichomonascus vanleenenianus]|uniref:Dop1p n=1 Tax=Trichomonascus vanleenenianus TaxID=2268995 RepID=UPI003ECADE6A
MSSTPFRSSSPALKVADPKLRQYTSNIEQALKVWGSLENWADYISFLGKLLRALNTSPTGNREIPHGETISVRLAQCLLSTQTSGVQQKALEVYSKVLEVLGEDLGVQAALWLPAITPVLSYASIATRQTVIDLLSRIVSQLPSLRDVLKSLLLALLPGIDDETSETFEAVFDLLDAIKLKTNDDSHFWQCMSLVIITSPDRRLGALVFLNRRLPKFVSPAKEEGGSEPNSIQNAFEEMDYEAQMAVTPDPGLLIRAFCCALNDDHVLVQRGFLDLLYNNLPLKSTTLRVVASEIDVKLLILSACTAFLRRDMSLNRRLWSWLLGYNSSSAESTDSQSSYFTNYGYKPLLNGLLEMINDDSVENIKEMTKPYRICLSLLDRWETGSYIMPQVFLPIIKSVKRFCESNPEDATKEVLASASQIFDATETINIGEKLLELIKSKDIDDFVLFEYILDTFNVRDAEMSVKHLPYIFLALLHYFDSTPDQKLWFKCCNTLIEYIPSEAYLPPHFHESEVTADPVAKIEAYYSRSTSEPESPNASEAPPLPTTELLLQILARLTGLTADALNNSSETSNEFCYMLANILIKSPSLDRWRHDSLVRALRSFKPLPGSGRPVNGVVQLFTLISQNMENDEADDFVDLILRHLWRTLVLPAGPKSGHVEAVRAIWALQENLDDKRVESGLASLFAGSGDIADGVSSPINRMRAFSRLWTLSIERVNCEDILNRLVFLVTDQLDSIKDTETLVLVKEWLTFNVSQCTSTRVFAFLAAPILNAPFHKRSKFEPHDDLDLFAYHVDTLYKVLLAQPLLRDSYLKDPVPENSMFLGIRGGEDTSFEKSITRCMFDTLRKMGNYLSTDQGGGNEKDSLFSSPAASYSRALASCLKLIDNTVTEHSLLELIQVLLELLQNFTEVPGDKFDRATAYSMGIVQVNILDVLVKCLSRYGIASVTLSGNVTLSDKLKKVLVEGLSADMSTQNEYIASAWISLLRSCLPLYDALLIVHLSDLCSCLCEQLSILYRQVQASISHHGYDSEHEKTVLPFYSYSHGLEQLLVFAYEKVKQEEHRVSVSGSSHHHYRGSSLSLGNSSPQGAASSSSPVQQSQEQGFFGNYISNVFAVESPIAKSNAANNRLTLLISFQEAVRISADIWTWSDSSVRHLSTYGSVPTDDNHDEATESQVLLVSKMKTRVRKFLTKLFNLEPLETSEYLVEYSLKSRISITKLVHVIEGSRSKQTVPHLINSIVSRVNSAAVDLSQRSSLTAFVNENDMLEFLIDYLRTVENDAIEEVWHDCITFITRQVQPNQSMYKQLMPPLLELCVCMGQKLDKIKFGEQRKIRRDLADAFGKLLNYALTTRSTSTSSTVSLVDGGDANASSDSLKEKHGGNGTPVKQDELISVLTEVIPRIRAIATDDEKLISSLTAVMNYLVLPAFKTKSFPASTTPSVMELLSAIVNVPQSHKCWKTPVGDALFDQRLFQQLTYPLAMRWAGIVNRWAQFDKERVKEYTGKLASYGSSSSFIPWSDATETTNRRINLKRLAFLFLCGSDDGYMIDMSELAGELESLAGHDPNVRGEVCLVLRAILLGVGTNEVSPVWPLVCALLRGIFCQIIDAKNGGDKQVDLATLVSGCKLLDMILCMNYEEFNLHEWLFVSDNMDAIFRADRESPTGIVDSISRVLPPSESQLRYAIGDSKKRVPILADVTINHMTDLKPFFDRLSMLAYEGTYSLKVGDKEVCRDLVIKDICVEK